MEGLIRPVLHGKHNRLALHLHTAVLRLIKARDDYFLIVFVFEKSHIFLLIEKHTGLPARARAGTYFTVPDSAAASTYPDDLLSLTYSTSSQYLAILSRRIFWERRPLPGTAPFSPAWQPLIFSL